mgnify:CR=1 FL=1
MSLGPYSFLFTMFEYKWWEKLRDNLLISAWVYWILVLTQWAWMWVETPMSQTTHCHHIQCRYIWLRIPDIALALCTNAQVVINGRQKNDSRVETINALFAAINSQAHSWVPFQTDATKWTSCILIQLIKTVSKLYIHSETSSVNS